MTTEPLDAEGVLAAAEGDLPDAAAGVDVGHVHLKVADVEEAVEFWTHEVGMELMARYGADAAFIADDGLSPPYRREQLVLARRAARAPGRARARPRRDRRGDPRARSRRRTAWRSCPSRPRGLAGGGRRLLEPVVAPEELPSTTTRRHADDAALDGLVGRGSRAHP